MECPLILYPAGTLNEVDYLSPCGCHNMCEFTSCKYRRCGILVSIGGAGPTATNKVSMSGRACGGSFPLVKESDNTDVTVADLEACRVYRIYPVTINGVLRGIVEGL